MSRAEANAVYRDVFDSKNEAAQRKLCITDLFYFLTIALKRKDADHDWLYARCREVQASPDGHLDLWARDHYKSTIITYALTIQDILRDPESTVGIFSHTRPIAKAFLEQIKRELETNEYLQDLFPEVLYKKPQTEAPKWSLDSGIIVKRKSNPKEATVEAWGLVDGQPTSRHFSHQIYDDVVTLESVNTPDQIAKTTRAWELSLNLEFKEEWLVYYETLGDTSKWNKYILVDPAHSKKNSADYTVMEVIGLAPDQNYYRLDAVRDRMNLTQRTNKLFELHRIHNPRSVGYERYGMQSDIEHIQTEMERRNYRFQITELGGTLAKEDRIKKLIPVYEQKRFYSPKRLPFVDGEGNTRDYIQLFNADEYLSFPVCIHDDMLDCLARILDPTLNAEFPKQQTAKPRSSYGGGGASSWMG
jgi:phage terminase large subunit-like protein